MIAMLFLEGLMGVGERVGSEVWRWRSDYVFFS